MTRREMIKKVKETQVLRNDIINLAKKIIKDTFDRNMGDVSDINITQHEVEVYYESHCYGECYTEAAVIPIKWFDEKFDYKKAYDDLVQKREEERKKREAAERKAAIAAAKKREYETYLNLKKKYEKSEKPEKSEKSEKSEKKGRSDR